MVVRFAFASRGFLSVLPAAWRSFAAADSVLPLTIFRLLRMARMRARRAARCRARARAAPRCACALRARLLRARAATRCARAGARIFARV